MALMNGSVVEYSIRPMRDRRDFLACVALQRDTWGGDFSDLVPASMMQVTAKVGGVGLGAFTPDGGMLGFVYGVTGIKDGAPAHWSHMLAVRPEARDAGIGRALKMRQKERLAAAGVRIMYWTFDPLVARNAHLNLNRLGAKVAEYVPNMYGESDSNLHQLGTDRFVVRWDLAGAERPGRTARGPDTDAGVRPEKGSDGDPADVGGEPPGRASASVSIPGDIEAVMDESIEDALRWRLSTRAEFGDLLGRGYTVTAFERGAERCRYVLTAGGAEVGR